MADVDECISQIDPLPHEVKKHYDAYKNSEELTLGTEKIIIDTIKEIGNKAIEYLKSIRHAHKKLSHEDSSPDSSETLFSTVKKLQSQCVTHIENKMKALTELRKEFQKEINKQEFTSIPIPTLVPAHPTTAPGPIHNPKAKIPSEFRSTSTVKKEQETKIQGMEISGSTFIYNS